VADQEPLLKHRVNPLLVLSNIMKGISSRANKFLDESWAVFNSYVTYKFLKKNENRAKHAVLKAEDLAQVFAKVFREIPSDSMLEAATLLYFILANEGISKRYEETLVRPVLSFISKCIRDYNIGVVTLESSPALSRCMGLSYIFTEKLSEEYKEVLKELLRHCDRPEPQYGYFCLYTTFSSTLKAILDKEEKDEMLCRRVANVSKSFSRFSTLETITLMLLTTGLTLHAGCRNEVISLKLFQKLAKILETNGRTLLRRSRSMWQALSLALKLNRLEKLTYVPEGYIVLKEELAKRLVEILSERNRRMTAFLGCLSLILGIINLVIPKLPQELFQSIPLLSPIASVMMPIAFILFVSFVSLILHEYIRTQSLLEEPEIRKLMKKLTEN